MNICCYSYRYTRKTCPNCNSMLSESTYYSRTEHLLSRQGYDSFDAGNTPWFSPTTFLDEMPPTLLDMDFWYVENGYSRKEMAVVFPFAYERASEEWLRQIERTKRDPSYVLICGFILINNEEDKNEYQSLYPVIQHGNLFMGVAKETIPFLDKSNIDSFLSLWTLGSNTLPVIWDTCPIPVDEKPVGYIGKSLYEEAIEMDTSLSKYNGCSKLQHFLDTLKESSPLSKEAFERLIPKNCLIYQYKRGYVAYDAKKRFGVKITYYTFRGVAYKEMSFLGFVFYKECQKKSIS